MARQGILMETISVSSPSFWVDVALPSPTCLPGPPRRGGFFLDTDTTAFPETDNTTTTIALLSNTSTNNQLVPFFFFFLLCTPFPSLKLVFFLVLLFALQSLSLSLSPQWTSPTPFSLYGPRDPLFESGQSQIQREPRGGWTRDHFSYGISCWTLKNEWTGRKRGNLAAW